MVRINLLPDRKQTTRRGPAEPTQVWIVVVASVLLLEIIGLLFVQKWKQDELALAMVENAKITDSISDINKTIADHPAIKAKLKQLRDREEAIDKLQKARSGPTATLLELSRVLTRDKGPTTNHDRLVQLQKDNPTAVYNPNWDPRRLWLVSYHEVDRAVKMTGLARDGEDVSELERRLLLSDYFYDVKLLPGAKTMDMATHQEVVRFELSAKVRY